MCNDHFGISMNGYNPKFCKGTTCMDFRDIFSPDMVSKYNGLT